MAELTQAQAQAIEGGHVIEKRCEHFGWPNTMTDGEIMYENRHFRTRAEALADLRRSTALGVRYGASYFANAVSESWERLCRTSKNLLRATWHYVVARVAP